MILALLLLGTLLALAASLVALDHDGYGTRPGPRSHRTDPPFPWAPPR